MAQHFNYPTWSCFSLDRGGSTPLHAQVFEQIRLAIVQGRIAKSSRLPPTRQLAEELGVSRNTVVLVYERLLGEGYVSGRVGAGTYIASKLPEEYSPSAETHTNTPTIALAPRHISSRAQQAFDLALPRERVGALDLSPTVPALDQLPFDEFAKVSSQYWRSAPAADLGYGSPLGLPELRRQIANYLGEAMGIACSPEQVFVVSGTTQGFVLAGHVLTDHGDQILVEDPGYITRLAALMGLGARLVHIPIDLQGLDSSCFDQHAPDARMIVASPTNQFPLGSTMPLERRLSLLQWANERNAWVIEYDFNNSFHFDGQPLPPLAALDRGGRVIYIGNFNRSISPALNLAYLVVPPDLVDAFARSTQIFSFQASVPTQGVVTDFMASGKLAGHIRRMGQRYKERAQLIEHCFKTLMENAFDLSTTGAGLHLSAISRTAIDDVTISQSLLEQGIDVPPISAYCMSEHVRRGFVLGFGNTSAERIAPSLALFQQAIASVHSRRSDQPIMAP